MYMIILKNMFKPTILSKLIEEFFMMYSHMLFVKLELKNRLILGQTVAKLLSLNMYTIASLSDTELYQYSITPKRKKTPLTPITRKTYQFVI